MPWFEYEGVTFGGSLVSGRIEADDPDAARLELARMNFDVNEIHPVARPAAPTGRLNADELTFFNQQLAGLASAGLALDEGLAQLARDVRSPRLRHWIDDLVMDLKRGAPLDQALAAREHGLPVLYGQVVRAGIETGKLPAVLLNLNQHLQAANTTRRVFWEAVSYPLVLGTLGLGLVIFFFMFVVPQFGEMFKHFEIPLPRVTLCALEVSAHFRYVLLGLGLVVGMGALCWYLLHALPGGRRLREDLLMLVPVIGGIHRASLVARFVRAVAVAVETGIPLPRAIQLSSDATGSASLRVDAKKLAEGIEQGRSILDVSRTTHLVPPLFGYCVQAGTSRENLPGALAELARAYEDRVVHGQGLLRAILLPLFILAIGGVMFVAILAMFLPLLSLIHSFGGDVGLW